jgi:cytoskeletal protein CcmA (bactofilin family)
MSNSIISSDVTIEGNIKGKGSIRIDGNVNGNIQFDDVHISSSGVVRGDIGAKHFINEGQFNGNVTAEDTELKVNSRNTIKLTTKSLKVEVSAEVVGKIKCGQ